MLSSEMWPAAAGTTGAGHEALPMPDRITGKRSGQTIKAALKGGTGLWISNHGIRCFRILHRIWNPVYRRAANNVPVLTAAFIAYGVLVAIPMMFNVYLNSAVCLLQFFLLSGVL